MSDTLGSLIDKLNVGDRFGLLTITNIKVGKRGANIYTCLCECGNTRDLYGWQLKSNKIHSCGCYLKTHRKLDGKEAAMRALYGRYRNNANNRNIEFSIPYENFIEVVSDNCYYCGSLPEMIIKPTHYDNREPDRWFTHNGIDRVDNTKGYIKGNCVPCCSICNMSKRTMTKEQFLSWVKKVYTYTYSGILDKSAGELIDALITIDIKCFMFQEKMLDINLSEEDRLKYANIVLELNKKRNKSMRAIDFLLGYDTNSVTPKTYKEEIDKEEIKAEF